jgi:RNA polymerase sigma-70 factor (ECF subfamily)
VQESWIRLSAADVQRLRDPGGWLTTAVARSCHNALRARSSRPASPATVRVPDPLVRPADGPGPEDSAVVADSVGLALLVVLDCLTPAERLSFVLHDMFGVPFAEIAEIAGSTTAAARQSASRARRRVAGSGPAGRPGRRPPARRGGSLLAASRDGDFAALLTVLDPGVVLRSDGGTSRPAAAGLVVGASAVAQQALTYGRFAGSVRAAVVNGAAGAVVAPRGRVVSVMAFSVRDGRITAIDVLADPQRLAALGLLSWPA